MGISDLHMHTCASWDCSAEMRDMCEQAVRLGLEAVAFTEHVELNPDDDHTYSTFDYHKAREIWEKVRDEFRPACGAVWGGGESLAPP